MRLETFAMERMQSTYENQVDFNLSESGVHPLTLGELVDDEESRVGAAGRRTALHTIEWNASAACGHCRAVSRHDARSRAGHQRRIRGELHHDVEPRRAW